MKRLRLAILLALGLGAIGLGLLPLVGGWIVKTKVLGRLSERIGRPVTAERVVVRWGRVILGGLTVDGGGPGLPPLVRVGRVTAPFRMLPLLGGKVEVGEVEVRDPRVTVLRAGDADNVKSLLEALRRPREGGGGGGSRRLHVDKVRLVGGELAGYVEGVGAVRVASLEGELHPDGPCEVRVGDVTIEPKGAATDEGRAPGRRAGADKVVARFRLRGNKLDGLPTVEVSGGTLQPFRGLLLTGIGATVAPDEAAPGRARVEAHGSYGGATAELWTAEGWVEPTTQTGDLRMRAARFKLAQLAAVLEGAEAAGAARVVDAKDAELDGRLDLHVERGVARFSGAGHLAGLTVAHPGLAPVPVPHLGFDATVQGTLDLPNKRLDITALHVDRQSVHGLVTAVVDRTARVYGANVKVRPVSCQSVLAALPAELVPRLQGFRLQGTFSTDVGLKVSWVTPEVAAAQAAQAMAASKGNTTSIAAAERAAAVAAQAGDLVPIVELGGKVGIEGCKVTEAPPSVDAKRLQNTFIQTVQYEPGRWRAFVAGQESPDWVPYPEISKHLVNSIMTTEDNGFFKHHGFIVPEFRSALQQNLLRGYFRLGASSITMQMVKNTLLSREKTLSRKLQELFLTWYVEKSLEKERILEVYFNVIEFGPGIYGIGPAARHYFGKSARDLEPQEAAFFSSILPSPKRRYVQYCHQNGLLDAKWQAYVNRIVKKNHERGRLTDEEFDKAMKTPLRFDRAEAQSERECMAYVKRITTPPVPIATAKK